MEGARERERNIVEKGNKTTFVEAKAICSVTCQSSEFHCDNGKS